MAIKIITARDITGWMVAEVNGFHCVAKVYNEPSEFGINDGRISKLHISKNGTEVYAFERGLDFDKLNPKTLKSIVSQIEKYIIQEFREAELKLKNSSSIGKHITIY